MNAASAEGHRRLIQTYARRASRRFLAACVLGTSVVVLSCGSNTPTTPEPGTSPIVPFPDSVRVSNGLPPLSGSASTRILAPDTIVQAFVSVAPVFVGRPMQVTIRVLVRDTSTSVLRDRTLALATCPFVLRLYRAQPASSTPVWQSDRASGALRCPDLQVLDTERTHVEATWDVAAVLGDSLPAGRYSFGYALRTADGRTLEFTGGPAYLTSELTPPSADLSAIEWAAESRVDGIGPRVLSTVVTLRNTGTRTVALNYSACNVVVRLHRAADRSDAPAWRSELSQYPGSPPMSYACPAILKVSHMAPGDTLRFPVSSPMYEVMGDSLRAARYYVSAVVSVAAGDGSGSRGTEVTRTLAAGAVDLTRDPDRLSSSRVVDSLRVTATTRIVRGSGGADTIRTLVLVANTSATRREADVARDCPVIVYAYRSSALRDSVPVQRGSAYPDAGCEFNPHHYTLEPGQSWVFGRDVPMAAARAALPAGRYWFTAWLTGPNAIIAAGDVDIR